MLAPPLRIRNYRKKDLVSFCEIDRVCFPEDIAFTRADFLSYLKSPKSIARVGERQDRILGFVMAYVDCSAGAHLITLDVIPEARQQGIGTALMTAIHRELQKTGVKAVLLEVSARNIPAQRLYKKLDYKYLETLAGYYRGREDAYRMVRILGHAP